MKAKLIASSLIATALFALAGIAPASAHPNNTPGVDRAQQSIRSRIQYGIDTGRITWREADVLFARERRLRRDEAAFKSDGRVTNAERRELREKVALLQNDVERKIANRQRY